MQSSYNGKFAMKQQEIKAISADGFKSKGNW
jgi:hypothetical protein